MAENAESTGKKVVLTLTWKLFAIILLIIIFGLTIYTRPWDQVSANPRTIEITGEATIKLAPDSFVFNPSYEEASQEEINLKVNEVISQVKALGLGDAGIQSQVSSYEKYDNTGPTGNYTYNAYLTFSVEDKELAQRIQDYLIISGATGQITPNAGFKRETQKALRDEATIKAVEDARARAEQTAKNLGVKLGKVIKINEPDQNYDVYPIASYDAMSNAEGTMLPINAGESEYPLSIKVKFEIR
jgi:uncharacterized protein